MLSSKKTIKITTKSGLENYVLLYLDTKLVYHIPGTDEPFTVAKYKKELGKKYSKICFYLYKDEENQSNLLIRFIDSVSEIHSFFVMHIMYVCADFVSQIYLLYLLIIFIFVMFIYV